MSEIDKQKEKLEMDIRHLVEEFDKSSNGVNVSHIVLRTEDIFVCGQSGSVGKIYEVKVVVNKL